VSGRWRNVNRRKCMDVKKCTPQPIVCEPDNPLEVRHTFQATKVYLINDEQGHEIAAVICPIHLIPIAVEPVRRPRAGGEMQKG
jgi:hypothetical protein